MENQAVEKVGLIPRSILRTLDRFRQQFLPGTKLLAMREFRVSREQMRTSVRCLITLISIPLVVNLFGKGFLIKPVTEYLWNSQQSEFFLNSYQENRAFAEMQNFQDKLFFESLLQQAICNAPAVKDRGNKIDCNVEKIDQNLLQTRALNLQQQEFQKKTIELASASNQESITAITDLIGDLITLITIRILVVSMKPQIRILKSFLTESLYSLSDATKSLLIILLTDLLVGYHSPKGWELFTEFLLRHYGFPENRIFILFFIGTFPVMVDTIFKYWIFRHLNRISPSTVVTYHSMIE